MNGVATLYLFAVALFSHQCRAARRSLLRLHTHELLIDLTWKDSLQPLLQARFPGITPAQLLRAHSYAYGGCAIQDLGYYPFNNEFFSDLAHYVRTGDLIVALLADARDANEYAFALGALSHYFGDNLGHREGVNPAVALSFPRLEHQYGVLVTYDENPHAHVRTEFAFDVEQMSKSRMAPSAYLRFIGLRVPTRLLKQAFQETYSLRLNEVDGAERPIVRSYRFAVRTLLPRIAYAEVLIYRKRFLPDSADASTQTFLASWQHADFASAWDAYRRKPSLETRALAVFIRILPKVGTLSELSLKVPTPETGHLYLASLNRTLDAYRNALQALMNGAAYRPLLPNRDLDTGEKTRPGTYPLTDKTYAKLLHSVTSASHQVVEEGLRNDILDFYGNPDTASVTMQVRQNLAKLRSMPVEPRLK